MTAPCSHRTVFTHLRSTLCAAFTLLPVGLLAQTAANAAAAAPAGPASRTLFERIMGGGVLFMGTLLLISIFVCWLVVDMFLRTARERMMPAGQLSSLKDRFATGDYRGAAEYCAATDSPFTAVARAGLTKAGIGKEWADDAIYTQLERERSTFAGPISYLSVVGVVTPMIGLTGTVFGMIRAFDTLGAASVGDPSKLSAAIGTVLVATAGGLVVAVPAFIFYYILRNRIGARLREIQIEVEAIFQHLPYEQLRGIQLDPQAFQPALPDARTLSPYAAPTNYPASGSPR